MNIKDLVYDGVKKISEAIKITPNVIKLFEKLPNDKLNISLTSKDFKYSYQSLRVGDRFYYYKRKGMVGSWRTAHVTYKRSGILFFKDESDNKEYYVEEGAMFFDHSMAPISILGGDSSKLEVTCRCPKTKIIYKTHQELIQNLNSK